MLRITLIPSIFHPLIRIVPSTHPPTQHTDEVSHRFRHLAEILGCSHDDFIRTTENRHKEAVASLWSKLEANGQIYLGAYEGWYSIRDEAFYQETELVDGKAPTGTPLCPLHPLLVVSSLSLSYSCTHTHAQLLQLLLHKNAGAEVEWVKEESYFFRLSEWTDKLLKFYEDNPDFIGTSTTHPIPYYSEP